MSEQIHELRAAIAAAEQTRARQGKQLELVTRLEERVELYRGRLASERRDVERLEGPGLVAFLRGLLVDRDRELDRERRELALAALLHDEARSELGEAREQLNAMAADLREVPELRERLEQLLRERASSPLGLAPDEARDLRRIELEKLRRELGEAQRAASDALTALDDLVAALGSAQTFATVDLLAGGALVSMIKRGQIGTARSRLATAQLHLRLLAREVEDLRDLPIADPDLGSFTAFVDVFFDNVFTDWAVRSRLQLSRAQAREVTQRVRGLHLDLRERLTLVERELRDLVADPR